MKMLIAGVLLALSQTTLARYYEEHEGVSDAGPIVALGLAIFGVFYVINEWKKGSDAGIAAIGLLAIGCVLVYIFPIILGIVGVVFGVSYFYKMMK